MTSTSYRRDQVGTLAADSLVRLAPEATVHQIAEAMDNDDVGAVIIGLETVDGIVSERDIVRAIAVHHDPALLRASDIATSELVFCNAQATMHVAAAQMMEHYVRHLLVEEGGTLVGIVSARDLLAASLAN